MLYSARYDCNSRSVGADLKKAQVVLKRLSVDCQSNTHNTDSISHAYVQSWFSMFATWKTYVSYRKRLHCFYCSFKQMPFHNEQNIQCWNSNLPEALCHFTNAICFFALLYNKKGIQKKRVEFLNERLEVK